MESEVREGVDSGAIKSQGENSGVDMGGSRIAKKKDKSFVRSRFFFALLVIVIVAAIASGAYILDKALATETGVFAKDGYVLVSDNAEVKVYPFVKQTNYSYHKIDDTVSFVSTEGNVDVNSDSLVHFADGSMEVLHNVVAVSMDNIDAEVVLYYNIFKGSILEYNGGRTFSVTGENGEVKFSPILMRISENRFLVAGDNVRLSIPGQDIVDFGEYAYIEYFDGAIIKIYNNEKNIQSVAEGVSLVVGDNSIDLQEQTVLKNGKAYISLSNLVIDKDGNISLIPAESEGILDVDNNNVANPAQSSGNGGNSFITTDDGTTEIKVDDSTVLVEPRIKTRALEVDTLTINAEMELVDDDALITSGVNVRLVENSTASTVCEQDSVYGNTVINIYCLGLSPDTEYTLYASASYEVNGVSYTKSFVNKIVRTKSLGVELQKKYATTSSIAVSAERKNYSDISAATVAIYNESGDKLESRNINFGATNSPTVLFENLDPNTTYSVKMQDLLSNGVIVENGYSVGVDVMTLKQAPTIGDLEYAVDKRNATFNVGVSSVSDPDGGIRSYRYEVYDSRQNSEESNAVYSASQNNSNTIAVQVDDSRILRGVAYRAALVVEFYDNEKIVEYRKDLGSTMQLDGVEFPTVRFESTYVTWEQINGVIVVEDPSNAVVSDKYKIVYKNSIGTYKALSLTADTTTGDIPININNLRANETYTFEVYADINLQDGNQTATETYIGSVAVQTGTPNNLACVFASNEDPNQPFAVSFSLANEEGEDSALEASTLSEVTFTLYEGSNVETGAVAATRRVVDTNDADYVSQIKSDYYDKTATLTPEFFNINKSELTGKTYTLKVSMAQDYTTYKNQIALTSSTFTFNTDNYLPDIDDPEDAFNVTSISNKIASSYGLNYDSGLDGNTVVGYRVAAKYNNSAKNALYAIYHVWVKDPSANVNSSVPGYTEVEGLISDKIYFDADTGILPPTVYKVENGTSGANPDFDVLRRGNTYRFSYDVYIDMDRDGTFDADDGDVIYPAAVDDTVVMKSVAVAPNKQVPVFSMVPADSTNTTVKYKYRYTDVDAALAENKLYSYNAGSTTPSSSVEIESSDLYKIVEFLGLNADNVYSVQVPMRSLKTDDIFKTTLANWWLPSIKSVSDLQYTVAVNGNDLVITINNYEQRSDIIKNIVSMDVNVVPVNSGLTSKTISDVEVNGGKIYISLFDIDEYIGEDVKIELILKYDTNESGFDVASSEKAIQIADVAGDGNYLCYENGELLQRIMANDCAMDVSFDVNNRKLNISKGDSQTHRTVSIDASGVLLDNNNIVLKYIKSEKLQSSNNIIRFDSVLPSISMQNSSGRNDIISLITGARVKANITVLNENSIKNGKIYIEVFETDSVGANKVLVQTVEKTLADFNDYIIIDNLKNNANYALRYYTYFYNKNTGQYDRQELYDLNTRVIGEYYYFSTLSEVKVSDISLNMSADSYTDKKLNIHYALDNISGYDRVSYLLEVWDDSASKYVASRTGIGSTTSNFLPSMNISVGVAPGVNQDVTWGKKCRLTVSVYGSYVKEGERVELRLGGGVLETMLNEYRSPYVGISANKSTSASDMKLSFSISASDPDHVFKNDKYSVRLTDQDGNLIKSYDNISTSVVNKSFTFSASEFGLVAGEIYTLTVFADRDAHNTGENTVIYQKSKRITLNNLPSIYTITAGYGSDSSIKLIATDYYHIEDINRLGYSVISTDGVTVGSGFMNIDSWICDAVTKICYITIPTKGNLVEGVAYLIATNFYSNGTLVSQNELNYYHDFITTGE